MKKIIKLFCIGIISVALASMPTLSMMNIDTEGAGKAAVAVLTPILAPIAEDIVKEAAGKLKSALTLLSKKGMCKANCGTLSVLNCSSNHLTRACKDQCQEMIKVGGGYTLKIRYTSKWSLLNCINRAVSKGKHTFEEKNIKSIAIYGEHDFHLAMNTIKQIAALDEFILRNGKFHGMEGKTPEELKKLVQEAKEESARLNKDFQAYVQANFGPQ